MRIFRVLSKGDRRINEKGSNRPIIAVTVNNRNERYGIAVGSPIRRGFNELVI